MLLSQCPRYYCWLPSFTACSMSSLAACKPGEILITADAAAAAGIGDGLERRVLDLRGKQQQTEVVALQIGPVRSGV